jgi:hypothetical protein
VSYKTPQEMWGVSPGDHVGLTELMFELPRRQAALEAQNRQIFADQRAKAVTSRVDPGRRIVPMPTRKVPLLPDAGQVVSPGPMPPMRGGPKFQRGLATPPGTPALMADDTRRQAVFAALAAMMAPGRLNSTGQGSSLY